MTLPIEEQVKQQVANYLNKKTSIFEDEIVEVMAISKKPPKGKPIDNIGEPEQLGFDIRLLKSRHGYPNNPDYEDGFLYASDLLDHPELEQVVFDLRNRIAERRNSNEYKRKQEYISKLEELRDELNIRLL